MICWLLLFILPRLLETAYAPFAWKHDGCYQSRIDDPHVIINKADGTNGEKYYRGMKENDLQRCANWCNHLFLMGKGRPKYIGMEFNRCWCYHDEPMAPTYLWECTTTCPSNALQSAGCNIDTCVNTCNSTIQCCGRRNDTDWSNKRQSVYYHYGCSVPASSAEMNVTAKVVDVWNGPSKTFHLYKPYYIQAGSSTNVTFTCATGMRIVGTVDDQSQVELCSVKGLLTVPQCESPTDITNGSVSVNGDVLGGTATYQCEAGTRLVGSQDVVCGEAGVWLGDLPVCEIFCSTVPSNIANGSVTVKSDVLGGAATYQCESGTLVGNQNVTCGHLDTWVGDVPVCEKLCLVSASPDNGCMITSTTNTTTVACAEGYEFKGEYVQYEEMTLECIQGAWKPIVECVVERCNVQPHLDRMESLEAATFLQLNCEGLCEDSVPLGSSVELICDEGYEPVDPARKTSHCLLNHIWSNELSGCINGFPMAATNKAVAGAAQVLGCSYVIGAVVFNIAMFFAFRQFTLERLIQIVAELSLLLAHVAVLSVRDFTGFHNQPGSSNLCVLISVYLHYTFLLHFTFLFIEALHAHTLLTNIHSKYIVRPVFLFAFGLAFPLIPVALSMQYTQTYHGNWSCWLNYDGPFLAYILLPIALLGTSTMAVAEASSIWKGKILPVKQKEKVRWARISNSTLSLIALLSLSAYVIGSFAVHAQRVSLYVAVFVLNAATGYCVFAFHTMADPKVAKFVRRIWKKACGKKKKTKVSFRNTTQHSTI